MLKRSFYLIIFYSNINPFILIGKQQERLRYATTGI